MNFKKIFSRQSKQSPREKEFDSRFGFILKHGIDSERNYNETKDYFVNRVVFEMESSTLHRQNSPSAQKGLF